MKKTTFEESLKRLETIVGEMENSQLDIDKAMKLFEEGMQLAEKIGFHLQSVYAWKRLRGMPVRQATNHGRWTVEWHEFCKWWKESKA